MVEDEKLRELSKDLLLDNVVGYSYDSFGEIIHKFKNGRIRKIDLFKRYVQITDSNGNELYSNILDIKHPLIMCANLYYKLHYLKKHACISDARARSLEREKKFILSQVEEIYLLL